MNQIAKLDLEQLVNALEAKIHYKMQDLNVLGEASKTLEGKERDKCFYAMADIFHELTPVHGYLRYSFPELEHTFDGLVDLYEKKHKKKPYSAKATKGKPKTRRMQRVITHPDDQREPEKPIEIRYAHQDVEPQVH